MTKADGLVVAREGSRLVVKESAPRVHITRDLWHEMKFGDHDGLEGAPELDELGLELRLGTAGRGLGRLTYDVKDVAEYWVTLELVSAE